MRLVSKLALAGSVVARIEHVFTAAHGWWLLSGEAEKDLRLAYQWNPELIANLPSEAIVNLAMARNWSLRARRGSPEN